MDDRHLPKLRLAQIAIKALLVDETIVYYPDLEEHYGELKDALINAGHEASLGRFGCNIHGHLHANRVMKARGVDARTGEILYSDEIDPRYWCACVEQTDFAPILFEDALKKIVEQGGEIGFRNGNGPVM